MFAKLSYRWTLGALVAVAAGAMMAACSDSPVVPPIPRPESALPIVLEWQHPLPQGNDLRGMWGFGDGTWYAVGEAGTVVHFDGASLTLMDTPVRRDLRGAWAGAPDDVYAAGFGGTLIHYDGTKWTVVDTPTNVDFYAVWASASDDVFVTGSGGSVWNYTSGKWVEYPINPLWQFRAMWGYTHEEVYVAGTDGVPVRFDGTVWTKNDVFNFVGDPIILDLWGPEPGSFALAALGGIAWYDGVRRGGVNTGTGNVFAIWGTSLGRLISVSAGLSSHWIDGGLTTFVTPTEEPLYDLWGTTLDDVYAVGRYGNMAHFDGASWQALNTGALNHLRDLSVSDGGALAVGAAGMSVRQNGSSWIEEGVGAGYDLSGVWDSGGGLSVAVGRFAPDEVTWRQAILMNTGASWVDVGPIGTSPRLFDVWGSSVSDVTAVGWGGEILHYDGTNWRVVESGQAAMLHSVSGTSSSDVWAVGRTSKLAGLIFHFDGTAWSVSAHPEVEELCAVWAESESDVFAVGSFGAILHYNGTKWTPMKSPTREKLLAVWGSSATDVYASGWNAALIHYDGTKWTRLVPATNRNLNAISGRSTGEVFFAGDRGAILFCDGM